MDEIASRAELDESLTQRFDGELFYGCGGETYGLEVGAGRWGLDRRN